MNKLSDLELECFSAGKGGKGGAAPAPEKKPDCGPSCAAPAPAPAPAPCKNC